MDYHLSTLLQDASATGPVQDVPVAMTIAGSDSGGGAGLQADLRTFAACEVHGTSAVTLITAQNTRGVSLVHMLPEPVVRAQFEALASDLPPMAAKTGALGDEAMIQLVSSLLTERPLTNLVVDPVMVSKHGDALMSERATRALGQRMFPLALVITPNRHEAEALTGRSVEGVASMKDACKRLFDLGPRHVLIKGSHLDHIVRDLLYDGRDFTEYGADRLRTGRLHGSGCVFSAAITARLALGDELLQAVAFAREFITGAIARAPALGGGVSPVNPMHAIWHQRP